MGTPATPHPKILLVNANILTMDPLHPRAECVAIGGSTISFVGARNDLPPTSARDHELIDCGGRTILPGFIDVHCHLRAYAESLVTLNLRPDGGISSISGIQSAILDLSRRTSPGTWIRGRGYNEQSLAEKRHPDRWDLDAAAPDHPVKLTHRSGHAHVLNSCALRVAEITADTPDPPGGVIDRDLRTGEPSGLLYEMGRFLAERIPALDERSLLAGARLANDRLLQSGVTAVQDASPSNGTEQRDRFRSWKETGLFLPAISMMLGAGHIEEHGEEDRIGGRAGMDPRITGVKIILDETTGDLLPSQAELDRIVLDAHRKRIQVAIHAVETRAIASACRAIRHAVERSPGVPHRHRIEHCSICDPESARRIGSLGITVVTHPGFIYYNGDRYLRSIPREDLDHLYPIRTLLDNGVSVAAGSDFPVDPPNPLIGVYSAVTRMSGSGNVVAETQAIPPLAALRMVTLDAANAALDEGRRGTIAPGKSADLVLLDGDPTGIDPGKIKDLSVDMTILGGAVAWERRG